jgi:glycerophosphoryl diester phosphodiesterase
MPPGSSDPLVFAHRGSSEALPEHTLDAYLRAVDEGVDGLECDVRMSRDGHLICIHDRRLDRTSNGSGLVSTSTLSELSELDFGSWHVEDVDAEPARVLTLERLIRACLDAARPLRLLIETKHPTRYGAAVERALVTLLDRYGLARGDPDGPVRVAVMSFAPLALRRVRAWAPDLSTVFLCELVPPGVRDGRLPFGAGIVGPGVRALRNHPGLVQRAHARGHPVYAWTVNEPEDVDLAIKLGVDGIISDRPAYVLSRLGRA